MRITRKYSVFLDGICGRWTNIYFAVFCFHCQLSAPDRGRTEVRKPRTRTRIKRNFLFRYRTSQHGTHSIDKNVILPSLADIWIKYKTPLFLQSQNVLVYGAKDYRYDTLFSLQLQPHARSSSHRDHADNEKKNARTLVSSRFQTSSE